MRGGRLLIDMHVHLARYEVLSDSTREWFISLYPSEADYQAVCEANASPDDFCAMLAEQGVDYAVILAEDTPAVTGVADNQMVADFCKGHPQLLPFCTFDPLKERDMQGQLRQLAAEGFRGVKLYPTYNFFYPNAPMMYPLYETAQELGLPVMFHTGLSVFKGSRLKYGNPVFYDDIAVDFPELKIIMCHGGRDCWYQEAVTVATLQGTERILKNFPFRRTDVRFDVHRLISTESCVSAATSAISEEAARIMTSALDQQA